MKKMDGEMEKTERNCLHCGRTVMWADDRWVDAYGTSQCPRGILHERDGRQFHGPHAALQQAKRKP